MAYFKTTSSSVLRQNCSRACKALSVIPVRIFIYGNWEQVNTFTLQYNENYDYEAIK